MQTPFHFFVAVSVLIILLALPVFAAETLPTTLESPESVNKESVKFENPVKTRIAALREKWRREGEARNNPGPVRWRFFLNWEDARNIRREYFGNDESFGKVLIDLFQNGDSRDRLDALDMISKCELREKSVVDFLRDSLPNMSPEEQCMAVGLIGLTRDTAYFEFFLSLLADKTQHANVIVAIARALVHYKEVPGIVDEEQQEIIRRIGETLIPFLEDKRGYSISLTLDMITSYPVYRRIALVLAELGYTTPELSVKLKELFRESDSLDIAYAAYCLDPQARWAFDFITKAALTNRSEWNRSDAVRYLGKIPQVHKRESMPYLKAVLEKEKVRFVKIEALHAMVAILEEENRNYLGDEDEEEYDDDFENEN